MKSSDLTLTIIIFLIFIGLYIFNIISVGIKTIKDNWPVYRCNPVIMPFASYFGQDPMDNFTYCIQNMQTNYMDYLLQPVNYNFSLIGNIGSTITDAINDVRGFFDYLRNMVTDIISSIFGVFLNILIEVQRLTINIKDLFSKLVGILVSIIYTIESVPITFESAWAGAPGQTIRFLDPGTWCFEPNTLIKLRNGEHVKIKDIKLNSILMNGTKVISVMNISNEDDDGNQREIIYKLENGEKGNPVYVTGNHLVFEKSLKNFVLVKNLKDKTIKTDMKCKELSCLITSDHTIPIGEWIFHDWEDNN
jgi:hypothetical protein